MKLQFIFGCIVFLYLNVAGAGPYFSDSASGYAKQKIVHRLQIKKISDLDFGEASPGDAAKSIAPGSSENRENASFEVAGEPRRSYQIILPQKNSVKLVTGAGGPHREILIEDFKSSPAKVGVLDGNGKGMVFVGATREALSSRLKTGDYLGQFYVTVVY